MYEKYNPKSDYIRFRETFKNTNRKMIEAYFGKNIFLHLWKLLKTSDTTHFKIIHTYFSFGEIIGFCYKLTKPEIKWIVSFVSPDEPSKLKSLILKFCYKKLDGVIYITEYVKKEKEKQFPYLKNIFSKVIYNGATLREVHSSIERKAKIELLTIGGLVEWKNTILLVKVAKELKVKNINFHLTIIGDGPKWKYIKDYIDNNDLIPYVDLIGYTSNVGGYLDVCDLYLHPSLTEGFGIAVAEAMQFSKAILVADAGALPELVLNNYNGYVISPYIVDEWVDKIIHFYNNPKDIIEIGANSYKRGNNLFSIDTFVREHDNFYNEVLQ